MSPSEICQRSYAQISDLVAPGQSLRLELDNRCMLAALYEAELAAATSGVGLWPDGVRSAATDDPVRQGAPCADVVPKAVCNYERCLALASQLGEYSALVRCATGLAELQIARRDLTAASATFDSCAAACCRIQHLPLRALLLQRVLPMSMEVLNMRGLTAESFARWRLLTQVLAQCGCGVPADCPICSQPFNPNRACMVLGCGHSFHRDCCDAWLGRRMMATGIFSAECPLCRQVDPSLKPTPAAAQALQVRGRLGDEGSASAVSKSRSATDSGSGGVSSDSDSKCSGSTSSGSTSSGSTSSGSTTSGSKAAASQISGSESSGVTSIRRGTGVRSSRSSGSETRQSVGRAGRGRAIGSDREGRGVCGDSAHGESESEGRRSEHVKSNNTGVAAEGYEGYEVHRTHTAEESAVSALPAG